METTESVVNPGKAEDPKECFSMSPDETLTTATGLREAQISVWSKAMT